MSVKFNDLQLKESIYNVNENTIFTNNILSDVEIFRINFATSISDKIVNVYFTVSGKWRPIYTGQQIEINNIRFALANNKNSYSISMININSTTKTLMINQM